MRIKAVGRGGSQWGVYGGHSLSVYTATKYTSQETVFLKTDYKTPVKVPFPYRSIE